MDNVKWVQTPPGQSWHIVKSRWEFGTQIVKGTYCGRSTSSSEHEERPANAKTCETCYRIAGPR